MSVVPLFWEESGADMRGQDGEETAMAIVPDPAERSATRNERWNNRRPLRLAVAQARPSVADFPLHTRPLPRWKRAMDIVGALIGLVLFAPLIALVALAVKLSSPGPIIFRQKRAGLGGNPFVIYKFRTMVATASEADNKALRRFNEQDGPVFKMSDDPRLTPVGKLLRRTSLDELPQFWNVLKGDMSLVGPRPLEWGEANACDSWERRRLEVTPGITCIWQVSGRSNLTFAEWIRMDLEYVHRRGFLLDLWLLIKTIPAVLLRKGAR